MGQPVSNTEDSLTVWESDCEVARVETHAVQFFPGHHEGYKSLSPSRRAFRVRIYELRSQTIVSSVQVGEYICADISIRVSVKSSETCYLTPSKPQYRLEVSHTEPQLSHNCSKRALDSHSAPSVGDTGHRPSSFFVALRIVRWARRPP